ncbi:MAG: pantetheine-phosphate adenylyltransferase [Treponemataceae bacterium]|nr:pantetheine-phosphate adenylyltransferase [Treponemataceae bacterium]
MISAVFAGSFDPPTYGHLNIIERSREIFDEVHVVISKNSEKKGLFSAQERLEMMELITEKYDNVHVHVWEGLVVDYAKQLGAKVLVRGIRNVTDFSYEFDLSIMNRSLDSSIETVFLPTEPKYFVLKSSAIKELASFGGDLSKMVPEVVAERLYQKFKKK